MNNLEYIKKYLPKEKLEEGKKLLEKGISPQYIVGNVNFYGNEIKVDKRVLIPRFETELLVEKSINYIKNIFKDKIKILDMCCGSGCIGITLKKEIDCDVVCSDISSDALEVALENANINRVAIEFINSDIFSNICGKFDVIVSNPPYISYSEEIDKMVRDNEPHLALYALNDGIYFYDKILRDCSLFLNDKFFIAFEIGYNQGDKIKALAYRYLDKDINVKVEIDLCLFIQIKGGRIMRKDLSNIKKKQNICLTISSVLSLIVSIIFLVAFVIMIIEDGFIFGNILRLLLAIFMVFDSFCISNYKLGKNKLFDNNELFRILLIINFVLGLIFPVYLVVAILSLVGYLDISKKNNDLN